MHSQHLKSREYQENNVHVEVLKLNTIKLCQLFNAIYDFGGIFVD